MGGSVGVASGNAVCSAKDVGVGTTCPAWVAVGAGISVGGAGVSVGAGIRVKRGRETVSVTVSLRSGLGVDVGPGVKVNQTTVAVS
jgi:hypothetical protein